MAFINGGGQKIAAPAAAKQATKAIAGRKTSKLPLNNPITQGANQAINAARSLKAGGADNTGTTSTGAALTQGNGKGTSNYSPLTPLTQKQIVQQATKSVGATYNPEYESITQQSNEAQAIAAKRDSDDQAYSAWLTTQTNALNASQQQQDQTFAGLIGDTQASQNDMYGTPGESASTQLTQQAQARMGAGSDVANNSMIGSSAGGAGAIVDQNQLAGTNKVNAAALDATNTRTLGDSLVNAATANNVGMVNNDLYANNANLKSTLSTLTDTLNTDKAKQAADTLSQINTLTSSNQSLANANRTYNANQFNADRSYGLSLANDKATQSNNAATLNLNQQKVQDSEVQQAESYKQALIAEGINQQKANSEAQNLLDEEHDRDITAQTGATNAATAQYNAQVGAKLTNSEKAKNQAYIASLKAKDSGLNGVPLLSQASQNTQKNNITQLAQTIRGIVTGKVAVGTKKDSKGNLVQSDFKAIGSPQLRQMLTSGESDIYYIPKNSATGNPIELKIPPLTANNATAWSAFQIGANGGLTQDDVRMLLQQGIDPSNLPIQPGVTGRLAIQKSAKGH